MSPLGIIRIRRVSPRKAPFRRPTMMTHAATRRPQSIASALAAYFIMRTNSSGPWVVPVPRGLPPQPPNCKSESAGQHTEQRTRLKVVARNAVAMTHRARWAGIFQPPGNRFGRIAPVLKSVFVPLRRAWGEAAMHPASAVRHCWRLTRASAPCPRSTSRAEVHRQVAFHGVDPQIPLEA
jgi:hypothetical protein